MRTRTRERGDRERHDSQARQRRTARRNCRLRSLASRARLALSVPGPPVRSTAPRYPDPWSASRGPPRQLSACARRRHDRPRPRRLRGQAAPVPVITWMRAGDGGIITPGPRIAGGPGGDRAGLVGVVVGVVLALFVGVVGSLVEDPHRRPRRVGPSRVRPFAFSRARSIASRTSTGASLGTARVKLREAVQFWMFLSAIAARIARRATSVQRIRLGDDAGDIGHPLQLRRAPSAHRPSPWPAHPRARTSRPLGDLGAVVAVDPRAAGRLR